MKNVFLAICLLLSSLLQAQLREINFKSENILLNGIETPVERSVLMGTFKSSESFYKGFIKEHLEHKLTKEEDWLVASQVMISQVTDKRGDLILYFYNEDEMVKLAAAFRLGYDVFLNPIDNPAEYKAFKDFILYSARKYYEDQLPSYVKSIEKDLKEAEGELKKANKEAKRAAKAAKSAASKIKKTEKKLAKAKEAAKLADEEDKVEAETKVLDYNSSIDKLKEEQAYQQGLEKVNLDLAVRLQPKIQARTLALQSAIDFQKGIAVALAGK